MVESLTLGEQTVNKQKKVGFFRKLFRFLSRLGQGVRMLFNILFLLIFIMVVLSFFKKEAPTLPDKAALRVAPGGVLVEQKTYMEPLAKLMQADEDIPTETLLHDLVKAIDKAATDSRITALVLEPGYLAGGGITKLNELGEAITRFKATGKPVIAVGDSYTQEQYYLASFADEIYLNPMGTVAVTGFGAYQNYFKEALDKLKINVHIFRVGTFKDAVEPFMRNDMSEASKAHNREWLNALWASYTSHVEAARNLPANSINEYVNQMPEKLAAANGDTARLALENGLVDKIATRPQMQRRLIELAGQGKDGFYQSIDAGAFLRHHQRIDGLQTNLDPKIGLIVASGTISDGVQPEGSVGGDTLAELFRLASRDSSIEAVVLRVDSPGGSAFASEVIRQAMLETQNAGKPVIVSMGSVAASGGYWISMGAREVWASPTTITGSIGVFGMVPTFEKSLAALGVHTDGMGTTELAGIYHLDRPMSEPAKQVIQQGVNHVYRQFIGIAAEARDTTPEKINEVAGGRVWTGAKAKELNLVDHLGGQQQAVEAAARAAGLERYQLTLVQRPLNFREQLFKQLSENQAGILASTASPDWLPQRWLKTLRHLKSKLHPLVGFNDPRGLYLHCGGCEEP